MFSQDIVETRSDTGARAAVARTVVDEASLEIQSTGGPRTGDPRTGDPGGADGEVLNVFSAWDFVRMVLILGAVIAAIFVIFYFLKRTGNLRFQETRLIRVLSSKAISGSRSLHLVEVGNQVFLVGSSDSAVSLVSEILDKETLDGLRLQAASTDVADRRNFSDVLSQIFGKQGTTHQAASTLDPVGFMKQQRQRVKNM